MSGDFAGEFNRGKEYGLPGGCRWNQAQEWPDDRERRQSESVSLSMKILTHLTKAKMVILSK